MFLSCRNGVLGPSKTFKYSMSAMIGEHMHGCSKTERFQRSANLEEHVQLHRAPGT